MIELVGIIGKCEFGGHISYMSSAFKNRKPLEEIMFGFLKKKKEEPVVETGNELIGAPVKGTAVVSAEVSDPTFGEEMLGAAMAIKPAEGKVYSPVNGVVTMTIDSNHAIGLESDRGTELLIHIGLDTVSLGGKHFNRVVKENQKVKKGDLLIEFDKEAVLAAGFDIITPVIICNTDDYTEVIRYTGKDVEVGDTVMELVK